MTASLKFGIRVLLPDNDPLSMPHLLGEGWSAERWFATEVDRDRAFENMQNQPGNYRKGDVPSVVLEKITR